MKRKEIIAFAVLFVLMALLIRNNEYLKQLTYDALRFCAVQIVPSLFLFLVLTALLTHSGVVKAFSSRFAKTGAEIYAFAVSVFSGFPSGAIAAVDMYRSGEISKERAEYICAFTNNASISFVIGFAGSVCGGIKYGIALFILQTVSALLSAFVLKRRRGECFVRLDNNALKKRQSFSDTVKSCTLTMLYICAFITVFYCLGRLVCTLLGFEGIKKAVLSGLFEFSGGIAEAETLSSSTRFCTVAFLLGQSGICVASQVASVTERTLSMRTFFISKLIQTAFMTVASFPLYRVL